MTTSMRKNSSEILSDLEDFFHFDWAGSRRNAGIDVPDSVRWSGAELETALAYLAQKSGLPLTPEQLAVAARASASSRSAIFDHEDLDRWINMLSGRLGLESEPVQSTYGNPPAI